MEPIRVFVGCSEVEWLPAKVLEYSIIKHASRDVEVKRIYESFSNPEITVHAARPRTNFSYQRFAIPQACEYSGRGIYLDSDMLVFRDIAELFDAPMNGDVNVISAHPKWRPYQNGSVMCIDAERCRWNIQEIADRINGNKLTYRKLMRLRDIGVTMDTIDPNWNCLDHYESATTKLTHYTNMRRQPWRHGVHKHALGMLWYGVFREALMDGFLSEDDVRREILDGHVHASVMNE